MDAFADDFKVPSKGKAKSYEIDYETLTQGAVEKQMQADVDHISGIFGVDVSFPNIITVFLIVKIALSMLLGWYRCTLIEVLKLE